MDRGASISLLGWKEYKGEKNRGWMRKPNIKISQAHGTPMRISGGMKLLVKIGGAKSVQRLYITPDLCKEAILEDRLCHHRASIEFNPILLIVNGVRTPLRGAPEESLTIVAEEDYPQGNYH